MKTERVFYGTCTLPRLQSRPDLCHRACALTQNTLLKVPTQCVAAEEAAYAVDCLFACEERNSEKQECLVGRSRLLCSEGDTEEMVKFFTKLFTKQLVITGTINVSDKGVRTQPSGLKILLLRKYLLGKRIFW